MRVQLCPTLCDPMGCSPSGSSVHGILQARRPEGVVIPFSRGSSWDRTHVSCTGRLILYQRAIFSGQNTLINQKWKQTFFLPRGAWFFQQLLLLGWCSNQTPQQTCTVVMTNLGNFTWGSQSHQLAPEAKIFCLLRCERKDPKMVLEMSLTSQL